MIGERVIQVIPHILAYTETIGDQTHKQTLGADIFKKHDQLQLKKHHWINGWPSRSSIILAHQIMYKREIQDALQMALKLVLGNQLLQGYRD